MKKLLLLFFCAGVLTQAVVAQDDAKEPPKYGWVNEMVGNLNFTQTSIDNPLQGGEDSWNTQLDINGKFVNDQKKYNWENTAKLSYGQSKIGDASARKSSDEIRFESVYTHKLGVYVNPYVAGTAQSQIASGYAYTDDSKLEISKFLNPGFFTESLGLGYEPMKNLKTRLGLAFKQTMVTDEVFAARYSTDDVATEKIEKIRSEVGMESVTDFSRKVSENIVYTTKLSLFSTLNALNETDVRWDNLLAAKVSKYVTVSFNLKVFYDRDIALKREIQQVLAAGLSYTFL